MVGGYLPASGQSRARRRREESFEEFFEDKLKTD